jgi:hypothetical protein
MKRVMYLRTKERHTEGSDVTPDAIRAIQAPTLVIAGDADNVRPFFSRNIITHPLVSYLLQSGSTIVRFLWIEEGL